MGVAEKGRLGTLGLAVGQCQRSGKKKGVLVVYVCGPSGDTEAGQAIHLSVCQNLCLVFSYETYP